MEKEMGESEADEKMARREKQILIGKNQTLLRTETSRKNF